MVSPGDTSQFKKVQGHILIIILPLSASSVQSPRGLLALVEALSEVGDSTLHISRVQAPWPAAWAPGRYANTTHHSLGIRTREEVAQPKTPGGLELLQGKQNKSSQEVSAAHRGVGTSHPAPCCTPARSWLAQP